MVTNMIIGGRVNDEFGGSSDDDGGSTFYSQGEGQIVRPTESGSPGKLCIEKRNNNFNQLVMAEDRQGKCVARINRITRSIMSDPP